MAGRKVPLVLGLAVLVVLGVAARMSGTGLSSRAILAEAQLPPAAEAQRVATEEQAGNSYAQMAVQFSKAARVASEEDKDAHRHGPVETLREASERLDLAKGPKMLSSAANRAALQNLAQSLRAYSQALIRNKHGLEFESASAYRQLSDFELKHPSLARIRKQRRTAPADDISVSLQSAAQHAREAQRLEREARAPARSRGERGKGNTGLSAPMSQLSREVSSARAEMQRLRAEGGPRQPEFPAFVGRQVKGFPYNAMGNMMAVVNAV